MTVDGCKNWKMINCECSGQWTFAEVNCSLILQTSSWFLASPIATLPLVRQLPGGRLVTIMTVWSANLKAHRNIIFLCWRHVLVTTSHWGNQSASITQAALITTRILRIRWLFSESPDSPILDSSRISAPCCGPSVSLSSSMGWSVLTSLWTWVLAQILPSEGEDKALTWINTMFSPFSGKYFWTILQPSAWWLAHCPFWLWHVGFKIFRFTYLLIY